MRRRDTRILSVLLSATLLLALFAAPRTALAAGITIDGDTSTLTISSTGAPTSTTWTATCDGTGAHSITMTPPPGTSVVTTSGSGSSMTLTAAGPGTATVTAACSAHSATAKRSVSVIVQGATSVSSSTLSFDLNSPSRTHSLVASYAPALYDAPTYGSYTWVSSNPAVATVSSTGLVTAVGVGSSTVYATFANTAGTVTTVAHSDCAVTVTNSTAPVSISPSAASPYTASGTTVTLTAVSTGTFAGYTWSVRGTAGVISGLSSATGPATSFTTAASGTAYIDLSATTAYGTTVTATYTVTVSLPDPSLDVTINHSTLTWQRPKTTAYATLSNANATVPDNSRVYWYTSNKKVATVSPVDKYLENGEATAVVRAVGNGTVTISAETREGRLIDSVSVLVTGYKYIPQTGQDVRLLYAEGAALVLLLAAAGIVYVKNRKKAR